MNQHPELELASRVQQEVDAFARGQESPFVLTAHPLWTTESESELPPPSQFSELNCITHVRKDFSWLPDTPTTTD